jgi:hypothetical protein
MTQKNRRQFLKTAGFGAAALALPDVCAQKKRPNARHVQRGVRTDPGDNLDLDKPDWGRRLNKTAVQSIQDQAVAE